MAALYACTKCHTRYPFDELSQGQQLCKECRGNYPVVKCTYCRTEFQQENKGSTETICKKCSQMVKQHGKPSACEYCNIIAAFIGNKCARCTNSEKKYGPPKQCEQCKQTCAFDRKEKVDGKLLCWLCMLSYKRVLAKAKKHDDFSFAKRPAREGATGSSTTREKPSTLSAAAHKAKHRRGNQEKSRGEAGQAASKKPRLEATIPSSSMDSFIDPNSSEHLIATTQLKEQITALKRQLDAKSKELLERDKKITELKALNWEAERDMRNKVHASQKLFANQINELQLKNREMNKSNTTLQKQLKEKQTLERRSTNNATKNSSSGALSAATLNNSADSGGSNTNSPMMSS